MKKRKRKHTSDKKHICLCAAISSKHGGLYGWAFTDVLRKTMMKCCIEHSIKKRNQNSKWVNLHRKDDLLKAPMSQRHSNYHRFVKTGFKTQQSYHPRNKMFHCEKVNFRCHVGAHWTLKGVPKSTVFGKKTKRKEKGGPRSGFEKTWFVDRCWC